MSINAVIALNALLDLGIVLAVAMIMRVPFVIDRMRGEAAIYAFASPLPEDLAA